MKKIAILQSNYLPWKGVFDMINQVDEFVFLEDAQYTKNDWRNRNKILIQTKPTWITVPVYNYSLEQLIYRTEIVMKYNWQRKHFNTFQINYSRASHYKKYLPLLEDIFLDKSWTNLSELNIYTTKIIAKELGITTKFINSVDLGCDGIKDDKLIKICKKLGATHYLSGPSAKNYIDPIKFQTNNIELEYIEYNYPEYNQGKEGFITHGVTVLDLMFHCGDESPKYIFKS
ncbi:MAG: hypothetical protein ATN35_01790 [Epulopiscium sp. Nele67-Bin004]|nr:MAG: hypothetical protein ATN35_01790 [Epulopiscium sp. Nele67-Bin004]